LKEREESAKVIELMLRYNSTDITLREERANVIELMLRYNSIGVIYEKNVPR
jgi:hypothetical protein